MSEPVPTYPPITLPRPRRRWLSILGYLLIFGCGILVGGGVTVIAIVHRLHQVVQHPERIPDNITARLTRRLDLRPDQHDQVLQILRAHGRRLMAINHKVRPEVDAQLLAIRNEVAGVLDDKQKTKWESIVDDFNEHWRLPDLMVPNASSEPSTP